MTTNIYNGALVQARIDAWFRKHKQHKASFRVWTKLKGYVYVLAATDYHMRPRSPEVDKQRALSYAWEDVTIALRGYGDNAITGFMLHMLATLPDDKTRQSLGAAWEAAVQSGDRQAEQDRVARRYALEYLKEPIICDMNAFTKPCVLPLYGAPVEDYVSDNEDEEVAAVILERLRERHGDGVPKPAVDEPEKDEPETAVPAPRTRTPAMTQLSRGHLRLISADSDGGDDLPPAE
jgi:hypothetical protein